MKRPFEAKDADTTSADMVVGQWVMHCEARTLDDIRAMGGNSPEVWRRFATAARVSEMNLAAYKKFMQALDQVHGDAADGRIDGGKCIPAYAVRSFQRRKSADETVETAAEKVREQRKPTASDNPLSPSRRTIVETES